jgi:hypothetical protein
MSDDADQKKPRGFEPPPWEREQFEELARRRAAAAEAAAAEAEAEGAAASSTGAPETPTPAQGMPAETSEDAMTATGDGTTPHQPEAPAQEAAKADPRVADAMLFELSGQEGPTMAPLLRAGKAVAGLMGAIGLAILVLGVWTSTQAAAAEETVGAGTAGGGIIMIFGLLVVGMAGWTWVRASRSQGS